MPTREERVELIKALEAARGGTHVIAYVTSTRTNLESQMAMDAIPVIYEHLRKITTPKAKTKIDLFIHSNGGDGIVPWRLVPLIREFCAEFTLLVPHSAFSAATLTALGADQVIMHPMGSLGPTDPTVTNPFNPPNPQNPTQLLGISVEDVSSYISLVRDDVGIRHEDELVQAFSLLARKIHPLALGNVKRATQQSRMMGEKLLRQRQGAKMDEHDVTELVEKLTSQLYFHGHPINREEARNDLRLSFVQDASPEVETAMWNVYAAYAEDMRLNEEFQWLQEAYSIAPVDVPDPPPLLGPGQYGVMLPNVETVDLPPVRSVYVESKDRVDVNTIEFEVTLRRDWTGEINANLVVGSIGWRDGNDVEADETVAED
jgi:hypothetical protein